NTGIVVLVVPKETAPDGRGQLKIETGTGTTRFITAAEAGRVADAYMIPYFREGDYGMGIYAGVMALAAMYAEEFGFELTGEVPAPRGRGQEGSPIMAFVLAAFVIYMILRAFTGGPRGGGRRRGYRGPIIVPFPMGGRHRGGWGGFGGGFGGFGGGGGFGGF